jgi:uncharacterized protein (TIGR02246 family)
MFRLILISGCVGLIALATGCSDSSSADAHAIQARSEEWSKAAVAKDAAKFASFYADDATMMLPNEPVFKGMDAIKNVLTPSMQDPNFALSFTAQKIEVSGVLGYLQGTLSHTTTARDGKPFVDKGKFVTVWKKQADGSWKIIVDISNSDLPPGGE